MSQAHVVDAYPLSPMQGGMLFHTLHQPEARMYFEQCALTLRGELDEAAFERAWQRVVEHHPALRTTFVWEGAETPRQVVWRGVSPPWTRLDWREVPPAEQPARLQAFMDADRERGLDLTQVPVMRLILIRLADTAWRLVWSHHHLLLDGWSLPLVLRQVFWGYEFYRRGQEPELAPSPPYKTYIDWLGAQDLTDAEAFWRQRLAGFTSPTQLGQRLGRRAGPGKPEQAESQFLLSPQLTEGLQALARQSRLTLNTLVQGAWGLLLSRYLDRPDVVFGATVSGRPPELPGVESMVGLFINTLPLRLSVEPDALLIPWLQALQAEQAEMRQYEYSPLTQIQAWSPLEPGTALFDTILVFENYPLEATFDRAELSLSVEDVRTSERTNYPLALIVYPQALNLLGETLVLGLNYDGNCFGAETIKRLADHLKRLLQGFVDDPDRPLADLPMLPESERRQLLVDWNRTEMARPGPACLDRLFEEQAARTPDAVALRQAHPLDPVYEALESGQIPSSILQTLESCCFQANPYTFEYPPSTLPAVLDGAKTEMRGLHLIKTQRHNLVVVNDAVRSLLAHLDGQTNLKSFFQRIQDRPEFVVYTYPMDAHSRPLLDDAGESGVAWERRRFYGGERFEELARLVQILYQVHLLELVDFERGVQAGPPIQFVPTPLADRTDDALPPSQRPASVGDKAAPRAPVLLLGATPGPAATGLLYLASFLRRHGVEAYCQPNDVHYDHAALARNVRHLLGTVRPKLVGVSLKWFPHIARGLEICRLVKRYAPETRTVLGGDTASYFANRLIEDESVDYVVRGDGELPLLKLALGEPDVPNLVYRQNGQIVQNPQRYVHTADNSDEIYLQDLAQIVLSPADLVYAPYIFVFTGQGCAWRCFYCAGACDNQRHVFNRLTPYLRPVELARRDISRAMPYTSLLMFDFDMPAYEALDYYRQLWQGLDLTSHLGHFYFWRLPSADFVALMAETFKYVYLHVDVCSLSERHRRYLTSLKVVKPQPSDQEILAMLEACEGHDNLEVTINLISGLPYFEEQDIQHSQAMLSRLLNYDAFRGLAWGRLHAQPGAPITLAYQRFGMAPSALTFEDYLVHSRRNLQAGPRYPHDAALSYPLIYYRDQRLNSLASKHYSDVSRRLRDHAGRLRRRLRFYHDGLTYRELDRWANRLAHYLRGLGVGPETVVGVCLERSTEAVVALLGVLKAGGAYLPLDPDYPQERLAYMLADAGVSVLVTREAWLERLPSHPAQVVCLDRDGAAIAERASSRPAGGAEPENLAYVIYTSGSTGAPKGVMVTQQGISNLALAQIPLFDLGPNSRTLQFASLNFDASVSEMFTTLLSGGCLYLARSDMLLGQGLTDLLRDQAITHLTLPPSLWAVLPAERLPALQTLVSAGEACGWDVVERWADGRRFLNFYGPTEVTIGSSCLLNPERSADGPLTAPIGRPIDNLRLYVLDRALRPVPVGVPGELYVGGVGVARGYLNRPGLTAERFLPDPFGPEPGGRLYRTGDRVRYLPDGNLEFLGRVDRQVKLRGFRIELAEIEAVLGQHPGVGETAVLLRQEAGTERLVAYYTSPERPEPTLGDLRAFLGKRLPDYMIPSAFVPLADWPLTPSGKVDRAALPVPAEGRLGADQAYTAPRNPVEEALAAIWSQVLQVERVGVHDNFFELGGDSIQSIQVAAAAAQHGYRLTTQQIFEHQTVAELAQVVDQAPASQAEQGLVTGPVPLTPIQRWFLEQDLPEPHHWNQAAMFELPEPLEPALLRRALSALLRHHDGLRARFERAGEGEWRQVIGPLDDQVPLERADLSSRPRPEQKAALEAQAAQAQTSLDLSQGPLLRALYADLGAGRPDRLLLVIHHLVMDGVSWGILMADLLTAYRQLAAGQVVSLPPKTSSYQAWAERLSAYAQSDEVLADVDYWLNPKRETVPPLPLDSAQGLDQNTEASARTLSVELDEAATQALLHEAHEAYNTQVDDLLLTTLAQAFEGNALLVDVESHGRLPLDDLDVSRTVGWFTSLYPLLLNLDAEQSPGQALKAVKEQRRAVPELGVSYGLLRYLRDDPILAERVSQLPQAQVSFNYLGRSLVGEWPLAPESPGPMHSPQAPRRYLIEVNAQIVEDRLRLDWTYSQAVHRRETVAQLAERYRAALEALIEHCRSPEAGGYTPSDFDEADLTQEELDWLLQELGELS